MPIQSSGNRGDGNVMSAGLGVSGVALQWTISGFEEVS